MPGAPLNQARLPRRPRSRPANGSHRRRVCVLTPRIGTASSAAAKPTLECVPSQKGFRVDAPHRQSVNGRLAKGYSFPFQSTTVTSSPSTSSDASFRTVIFAMSCLSPVRCSPGLKTRPPCAARERTFCLLSSSPTPSSASTTGSRHSTWSSPSCREGAPSPPRATAD